MGKMAAHHSARLMGFKNCEVCEAITKCTCSPRKSAADAKREREDKQDREADAYLAAHGRPVKGFSSRSKKW